MVQEIKAYRPGHGALAFGMLQPEDVHIQGAVPFEIGVGGADKVIHESRKYNDDGKRYTDAKETDKSKELPSLQYRDGYFKIIDKHKSDVKYY
jgi:hypothetical protein